MFDLGFQQFFSHMGKISSVHSWWMGAVQRLNVGMLTWRSSGMNHVTVSYFSFCISSPVGSGVVFPVSETVFPPGSQLSSDSQNGRKQWKMTGSHSFLPSKTSFSKFHSLFFLTKGSKIFRICSDNKKKAQNFQGSFNFFRSWFADYPHWCDLEAVIHSSGCRMVSRSWTAALQPSW